MTDPDTDSPEPLDLDAVAEDFDRIEAALGSLDADPTQRQDPGDD